MSQSLAEILLHIVFTTKQRRPFLKDKHLQTELHAYMAGCCRNLDSPAITIGGVEDHVHLLLNLSRTRALSDVIREIKRGSSSWIKDQGRRYDAFRWQDGYGAFSVSPSHVSALKRYVAKQEEHHQQEGFQEEFRRLLAKYQVEYDERYVWD